MSVVNLSRSVYLLLLPLLAWCAGFTEAQEQIKTKIAVILPLTGALAEFGVAARHGFELAQKDRPELFRNTEFLFDDSRYESKLALSGFQKFRAAGDVSLAYVWGYGPNQAIVPLGESQRFPVIAVSAERSVSADKKYVLRFCYHIEMVADVLLAYLRSRGLKRLAVVKTELAYMNGLLDFMKKNLKAGESIDIIDTYQPDESSFKASIVKLRSKTFDVLGVFLMGEQISQFYREMKQLNFKAESVGTDFFDSMKLARDARGTMAGAVFAAPFVDRRFVSRYIQEYGDDVQVAWAANAYEFAMLSAKLFGKGTRGFRPRQFLNAIRARTKRRGRQQSISIMSPPKARDSTSKLLLVESKASESSTFESDTFFEY